MRLFSKIKIEKINASLQKAKKVAIISHYNPDGDAVGSSLAMYHYLKNEGLEVKVILPNPFPDFLGWMPGSGEIIIAEKKLSAAKRILQEADVLFVMDMNAPHRSGANLEQSIIASSAFKVLIDHHILPNIDCDAQISTPNTTSTCELTYQTIVKLAGTKEKVTHSVGTCIYVGMITDTGSLSYMCNRSQTYQILNELMKKGVDGERIHREIYDNYSESRIKLLGLCLGQRLVIMRKMSTSYMYLTKEDLKNNNYVVGDTEGFVNYGLSMRGIQFTALFIERENRIRISFRSKGNFDVSRFARTHFDGGGHKNASAAYFYGTLEGAIEAFKTALEQYKAELLPEKLV